MLFWWTVLRLLTSEQLTFTCLAYCSAVCYWLPYPPPEQISELGHYCLPRDSQALFTPLSQQIRREFSALFQPPFTETPPTETPTTESVLDPSPLARIEHIAVTVSPTPEARANANTVVTSAEGVADRGLDWNAVIVPMTTVFASSIVAGFIAYLVTWFYSKQSHPLQVHVFTM